MRATVEQHRIMASGGVDPRRAARRDKPGGSPVEGKLARCFLVAILAVGAAGLFGCGNRNGEAPQVDSGNSATIVRPKVLLSKRNLPPNSPAGRIDRSLLAAAQFLIDEQSADGAWRSDFYPFFKDGFSLTPLVLRSLSPNPSSEPELGTSYNKGVSFLTSCVRADGTIDESLEMSYPVYTAAGAVVVLSKPEHADQSKARDAWLSFLRKRQLTEDLGWQSDDKPYGGWGYCKTLPHKPSRDKPMAPFTESNLSATVFALEALRAAEVKDDAVFQKALVFVKRCQNFADNVEERDTAYDDGGFYFIYDDGARNKAGPAGKDKFGRERYRSYGSPTADGLRALQLCGPPLAVSRSNAALSWLTQHFQVNAIPGQFNPDRQSQREAYYYYYSASLAQALRAAKVHEIGTEAGKVKWAEKLAEELIGRQGEDGSWTNPLLDGRENVPLLATPLAMIALAECSAEILGESLP